MSVTLLLHFDPQEKAAREEQAVKAASAKVSQGTTSVQCTAWHMFQWTSFHVVAFMSMMTPAGLMRLPAYLSVITLQLSPCNLT